MKRFLTASALALATLMTTAQADHLCPTSVTLAPEQTLADFESRDPTPQTFEEEMRDLRRGDRYRQKQRHAEQGADRPDEVVAAATLSLEEEMRDLRRDHRTRQANLETAVSYPDVPFCNIGKNQPWQQSLVCLAAATTY